MLYKQQLYEACYPKLYIPSTRCYFLMVTANEEAGCPAKDRVRSSDHLAPECLSWASLGVSDVQRSPAPRPSAALCCKQEGGGGQGLLDSQAQRSPLDGFLFSHYTSFFLEDSRNIFLTSVPQVPFSFLFLLGIVYSLTVQFPRMLARERI